MKLNFEFSKTMFRSLSLAQDIISIKLALRAKKWIFAILGENLLSNKIGSQYAHPLNFVNNQILSLKMDHELTLLPRIS